MTRFYNSRIGFMQGRLSELVDGRIQAFPWDSWQTEFFLVSPGFFLSADGEEVFVILDRKTFESRLIHVTFA